MNTVFFGPWVGEFGWEISKFQTAVRHFCENRDAHFIVMSKQGHDPLYELCDEFWPLPQWFSSELERNGVYRETARVYLRGADKETEERIGRKKEKLKEDIRSRIPQGTTWKDGKEMTMQYLGRSAKELSVDTTEWSEAAEHPYFCISYRNRQLNDWGNWERGKWSELIQRTQSLTDVKSYVVLGRPEEIEKFGGNPPDPEDNLRRSIDLLSHCEFSITPESGSGFLSTACGAPTITFGHENHRRRYKHDWNLLGTPVKYVGSPDRIFTPERIAKAVEEFV